MVVQAPGGVRTDEAADEDVTGAAGAVSGAAGSGAAVSGAAAEGVHAYLSGMKSSLGSFMGTFDPGCLSASDAALLVPEFAWFERFGLAGKTLAATRSAEANIHRSTGQRTAAEWLADQTGESLGDAIDTLQLGNSLKSQPGVEDAVRKGKLSHRKAKTIAAAVKENPDAEGELLDGAETDSLRTVQEKSARARARAHSKEDEDQRDRRQRKHRSCRTWTDDGDGMFQLHARLTPKDGARLRSALERATDKVFHRARRSGVEESRDAYQADALVELVTSGAIVDPTTPVRGIGAASRTHPDPGSPDDEAIDEATDEATDEKVPGSTDATAASTTGTTKGSRSNRSRSATDTHRGDTVHVRVDLEALRNGFTGSGQVCEIPGVGPISVETAREVMGNALCRLVITNGVDVTTICNLSRHIPAPIAAALLERDPTCVVPGCNANRYLETDHWQVDFADDGPTAWWNLCHLCSAHHRLKTRGLYILEGGPGAWRFTPTAKGRAQGYGSAAPPSTKPPPHHPPDPIPPEVGDQTLFPHTE